MCEHSAVPLCLPNNCKWDEKTSKYSKNEDQERTRLHVINTALEQLTAIEGGAKKIKTLFSQLTLFCYLIIIMLFADDDKY